MTTIFFFLFLLLSPLSTTATQTPPPVLDTSGRPLLTGAAYYIYPVLRGHGGGLTMSPTNKTQPCPLYVSQETQEAYFGKPLKFYPKDLNDKKVPQDVDINIVFNEPNTCVKSNGWMLTYDEDTRRQYVRVGGIIGNPGVETLGNWFVISKAGSGKYDYKISWCPGVCPACTIMCGVVGVFVEDGARVLGLNDSPLLVRFKKA